MEKTATDNVSQRNRTNMRQNLSHKRDKSCKWEINDQDAQDFQELTIILKIFGVVKLQ